MRCPYFFPLYKRSCPVEIINLLHHYEDIDSFSRLHTHSKTLSVKEPLSSIYSSNPNSLISMITIIDLFMLQLGLKIVLIKFTKLFQNKSTFK